MEFGANFQEDIPLLSSLLLEKPIKPEFPTMVPLQSSLALNNNNYNSNNNIDTFQHFLQHPINSMNVSSPGFMMKGSSSSNPFSGMPPTTTLFSANPFKQTHTNGFLMDFVNAYHHIPQFEPNNNMGTLHGYPSQPSTTPFWDFSQKIPVPPLPSQSSLNVPLYQPPLYNEDYRSGLKHWLHDELSAFVDAHSKSNDQRVEDKKKRRAQMRKASRPERTSNFVKGQWTPEEDMYRSTKLI